MTTYLAADVPSWTDQGAFWIALVGVAFGLISLVVTYVLGRRSIRIADRAAEHAKDSAESAAAVARAELSRDHEMYRPQPTDFGFRYEASNLSDDRTNLFFTFTVPRGYWMDGRTLLKHGGRGPLSSHPTHVVEAGKPVKIHVDDLSPTNMELNVKELQMEFWPPRPGDPGEPWTCPCGGNVDPEKDPHWVWNVPVELPKTPIRIGGRLIA